MAAPKVDVDSLKQSLDVQIATGYLRAYTLRDDSRWSIEPVHSSMGSEVLTTAEVRAFIHGMRAAQIEQAHRDHEAAKAAKAARIAASHAELAAAQVIEAARAAEEGKKV